MTGTIRNVWHVRGVVLLVLILVSSHVGNVLAKKRIFSNLFRWDEKEGDTNTLLEQTKPWWRRRRGNAARQEGRFRKIWNASEDIKNHGSPQKFFKRRSRKKEKHVNKEKNVKKSNGRSLFRKAGKGVVDKEGKVGKVSKQVKVYKNKRARSEQEEKEAAVASKKCRGRTSFVLASRRLFRRRGFREKDVKTAYRMCLLSALAYWQFDRRPIPEGVTGFRLVSDSQETKNVSRARQHTNPVILVFRLQLCRYKRVVNSLYYRVVGKMLGILPRNKETLRRHKERALEVSSLSCWQTLRNKEEEGRVYNFDYWFHNWHEPTRVPKLQWHDTDLLLSTSGKDILVLSFAGTASAADLLTDVQTFEPASHSALFDGGGQNITIEGSLHRGFLNAYSRVERGRVARFCEDCHNDQDSGLTRAIHRRYGHCHKSRIRNDKEQSQQDMNNTTATHDPSVGSSSNKVDDEDSNTTNTDTRRKRKKEKKSKSIGCRVHGEKLMVILREVVTEALLGGQIVHLTGHSLGGGLTTLLALDIIINFPDVPVSKLHVWTFGGPQVADEAFFLSAVKAVPRLRSFVQNGNGKRFHRFVTLSDNCEMDFVSTVAARALPSHKQNLRGYMARRLGGAGGDIVHLADPYYLLPPEPFDETGESSSKSTTTKSAVTAHLLKNYLHGISRESNDHPLMSDLPAEMGGRIGEHQPRNNGTMS